MKFVPRDLGDLADNSSGGGTRGMRKEALALAGLVLVTLFALFFGIGLAVDLMVAGISPQREAELFGSLDLDIEEVTVVPEAFEERWQRVETLLQQLITYDQVPALPYRLHFVDTPEPNAFAYPGGTIGVTRGLLESLSGDMAIAFVLAHELGHFAHRDHLRGIGRQLGFRLSVQIIFGGSMDALVDRGQDLLLLGYSRNQESRADRFALECIDAIYGEREGIDQLFQQLEEADTLPDWAYMFSTHPNPEERLKKLRQARDG